MLRLLAKVLFRGQLSSNSSWWYNNTMQTARFLEVCLLFIISWRVIYMHGIDSQHPGSSKPKSLLNLLSGVICMCRAILIFAIIILAKNDWIIISMSGLKRNEETIWSTVSAVNSSVDIFVFFLSGGSISGLFRFFLIKVKRDLFNMK